jgi:hypothetical protein
VEETRQTRRVEQKAVSEMKAATVLVGPGRAESEAARARGDGNARHRDKQRSRVTHEKERKIMFMDLSSAHACVPNSLVHPLCTWTFRTYELTKLKKSTKIHTYYFDPTPSMYKISSSKS